MSDFQVFMPIAKIDKDKRTVSGYASTPTKDGDGEIVTLDAIRGALPEYMAWANIREMHALKAVGTAQEANIDTQGLFLTAKIVDDAAWQKCVEGVYKGFSIGGRKLDKKGNKITAIEMTEISVVDRPSNPDCSFALAKSAKEVKEEPGYLIKAKTRPSAEAKALAKMAKIVGSLAKANPPAAHDGFSLPAVVKAEGTADVDKACEPHGAVKCTKCSAAKAAGEAPCEKHGHLACDKCSVQKRDFSQDKRSELANSGAALPDGSYPIENVSDLKNAVQAYGRAKDKGKAKAHIISRAKSLGATSELPDGWTKVDKMAKKLAKAKLNAAFGLSNTSFFTLTKKEAAPVFEKSMNTAGSLAYCFDSLRNAQRSLMMEGKREGGDGKDKQLAKKLGVLSKDLAGIIAEKATHEGQEAIDLTDADDQYLSSLLGEDYAMDKVMNVGSGDPLTDAVAALMKRAAMPTRAQRMASADDKVKKSRKAAKAARSAVEEVHKMLKASYIAKMEKAKKTPKKDDEDDNEFDHAGAMEKLQKAYQEIDKARMFGKAAQADIAKAAARSGQRGQEAGDAEGGFYEVPAGVTDLSPSAMSGAAPGSKSGGSQPPAYPVGGEVYSGKAAGGLDLRKFAKDGKVDANVMELLLEKSRSDGELEALRRLPAAGSGGRRPYAFDMTKVMGGTQDRTDINKALFEGVDVNAIGSGDELAHTNATAKAVGNFLTSGHFGKSIMDPDFRGMAGGAK